MLKVFLVNYWYISIENILRESIKVFLRRTPRVRNDLDEALLSSEKVIINENTLMIWSLAIEDGLMICIDRFFASAAHFTLEAVQTKYFIF